MDDVLPPFQSVYEAHRDDVWRFCLAVAGPDEAEDCFQETFLAALRAYPHLEHGQGLRAWVLTIAHRKAMDGHRRRARAPRPAVHLPEEPDRPAGELDGELWARVRALPPKQRTAIAYRFAADMSYGDVATMMSCTPEAARRSVHEGIRKLREAMGA